MCKSRFLSSFGIHQFGPARNRQNRSGISIQELLYGEAFVFTSVPQQISTPLVTFAPSFLTPINEANVNKLVQGFDFLFGSEMGFGRGFSKGDIGTAFLPTGTSDTKQKFSAYLSPASELVVHCRRVTASKSLWRRRPRQNWTKSSLAYSSGRNRVHCFHWTRSR